MVIATQHFTHAGPQDLLFPNLYAQFAILHEFIDFELLDPRWERAEVIVRTGQVKQAHSMALHEFEIASQGKGALTYQVCLTDGPDDQAGCECQDYAKWAKGSQTRVQAPDGWCKHRLAAWITTENKHQPSTPRKETTMDTQFTEAPFAYTLKLARDGSYDQLFTARGETAEEIAARIQEVKAIVTALRNPAELPVRPAQQRPATDGANVVPMTRPAGGGQRNLTNCPQCGQLATFVQWGSNGSTRKALVCYECNGWVNKAQDGTVSFKPAQGPLPTRDQQPRQQQAQRQTADRPDEPEDLPF